MANPDDPLVERVQELIQLFQQDENRFYVELDIAHQLLEQLTITIDDDTGPSE